MGKGDTYRPVNQDKYDKNWLRLYGVKCPKCKGEGVVGGITGHWCLTCNGHGLVEPRIAEKYNVEPN